MSTQTRHVLTSSHGFTLVELMVTIAVLGIIASIATPSISLQLANMRVKSTAATLENALKEAKAESAIRRQDIPVTYTNGTTGGTITVGSIRTYDYDAKSTIKKNSTATSITFRPSKTASDSITYTICDSNASASPRQVKVNKLAVITTQAGVTC
ncbi:pilus assembly FimT family protein [Psychrobacter aestuarii]|uniref:Type II secretion system protein H n=1 Tax=Psychrobacter aestuarii TaxID=556327 RepID=A0ABN0VK85_9GAMM|nr:GspH/FimT family pseudopilin [Psychrobacter aestuarii]